MAIPHDRIMEFLHKHFPFNLLDEFGLSKFIFKFSTIQLAPKTVVYKQGDIPEHFYMVLSGTVRVTGHRKSKTENSWNITSGDPLGEEALRKNIYRQTDAVCLTQVELLRIDQSTLADLQASHPMLRNAFNLFLQTLLLRLKIAFPWLGKEEKVCLISRRHKLFLFLRIILSLAAGFAVFGLLTELAFTTSGLIIWVFIVAWLCLLTGLMIAAWTALEWTNDFFIITRERVLVQKKMIGFFESRHESPFSAILSTDLETSFIGRTLGFGAINLRSYTGNLRFKRLPFANLIYELLENQRSHVDREARHQDKDHMREALEQRLSNTPGKPVSIPTSAFKQDHVSMYQSGSFLDMAAHFFGLRFVKGQAVIYRTHWWVLLGKTILPTLLLIAIALLAGAKWLGFVVKFPEVLLYTSAIVATIISWGWWLYQYIDWHNDVYIITPDQLVDVSRKPLGSEQRRSAPLKNIQTVEFMRKGIIGLILNFGTVHIQIGNEELTFDNVYDPAAIQAEIFDFFKQHNERTKQNEQEKLADWIQAYDQIKEKRIAGSATRIEDKRE